MGPGKVLQFFLSIEWGPCYGVGVRITDGARVKLVGLGLWFRIRTASAVGGGRCLGNRCTTLVMSAALTCSPSERSTYEPLHALLGACTVSARLPLTGDDVTRTWSL